MRMNNWTGRALTVTIAVGLAVGAGRGGAAAADTSPATEAEYCDAALAAQSHPITGEESPEELATFIEEYFDTRAALLPASFADDVAVLRAAIVGEPTDDYSEAIAADARIHEYSLTTCEWSVQPVRMAEYAFEGVPESLPAGLVS